MGGVRVQEMGVQNAHHVANLIEVKEEDECVSVGYRSNDIPANGLCDLLHRDHFAYGRLIFLGVFVPFPACSPPINVGVGF